MTFRGPNILYSLRLNSGDVVPALVPSHFGHEVGEEIGIEPEVEEIGIELEVEDIVLFIRTDEKSSGTQAVGAGCSHAVEIET